MVFIESSTRKPAPENLEQSRFCSPISDIRGDIVVAALTINAAKPTDVGSIRAIVRAAYSKWIPLIGREPRPMVADYEKAIEVHQIDLLQVGPDIVGLIETALKADHIWIENVAVKPEAQRKGYGSILMAHAEKCGVAGGVAEVRLLTNEDFVSNVALYGKCGFIIDRKEPFMGGTTVYMSKKIK
jgi:ribosomal protein S18 acetylase RimI-like enzyme